MKTRSLLFFILLIGKLGSQITASKTSGCAPLTASFNAPSGMSTYYWDFGNGGSSTDKDPSGVIFTTPQNPYKVTLRACKTCPVLHTIDITVYPKPSITIPEAKGCPPLTVDLNPTITLPPGVTATSLKYIFDNGSSVTKTSPNLGPVNHTFSKPNSRLPVSFELITSPASSGCNHSVTISDKIYTSSIDILSLTANPSAGCIAPFTTTFNHSINSFKSIVSYEWDFGDGNTSTDRFPSHTYTALGTYAVKLKVTDEYGCERLANTSVVVQENDMTKIVSVDTICINTFFSLDIDGNSGLQVQWNLSGGGISYGRPVNDFILSEGLKTIKASSYYTGGACFKSVTKQVYAIDPKIEYTIVPLPLCNKSNTFTLNCTNSNLFNTIKWQLHSGEDGSFIDLLSNQFLETLTYDLDDLDTIAWKYKKLQVNIIAESKYGCTRTVIDPNFISPLIAHVVPTKTEGCAPLKVGFFDKTLHYRLDTLVEWKLIFGDGNEITRNSFSDTFYHTYTQRGSYDMKMIVKNKHGCIDTTYVTRIDVGTPHTADFTVSPPGNLCASDPSASITLQSLVSSDSVQSTKFWADGFQCTEQNSLVYRPSKKAGNVEIKMEVIDRGCFSSISKMIAIKGPVAKFQASQDCDSLKKVSFINTSQDADSFLWNFGDGTTSKDTNVSHSYAGDGDFMVSLIAYHASNGCPPDTYILPVKIQTPYTELAEDTFKFCHDDLVQLLRAQNSSGIVNDGRHSSYIWNFASRRAPSRTFNSSIDYNVHSKGIDSVFVSVRNFMNCTYTDTATVMVDRISLSPYTVNPTLICNNDTVKFDGVLDAYFPITIKKLDFGDGSDTNIVKVHHNYKFSMRIANFFNYNIDIENNIGCEYTTSGTLTVKKLNLSLLPASDNLCLTKDLDTLFISAKTENAYPSTIYWKRPDNSQTIGDTTSYKFITDGSFNFQVYAIDSSNDNCKDTISTTVNVHKKPDLYLFTDKDHLETLCDPVNLDITFSDSNNTSLIVRDWKITDSVESATFSNNTTVSKALKRGLNKVQLIARTQFCIDTVERDLIVKAPSGNATIDRNGICKGEEILFTVKDLIDVTDFSIDFGDGTIVHDTSPILHKYNYVPLGGQTVAKIIFATNGNDCVGVPFDTTINIYEAYAKFSIDEKADTPICYRAVLIKDSSLGADRYLWDFGDGSLGTMKEPGYKTFLDSGLFHVVLAIENTDFGCKDTFRDSVRMLPLPLSKLKSDTFCQYDTAKVYQMVEQERVIYQWNPIGIVRNNNMDTMYYKLDSTLEFTSLAIDTVTKCTKLDTGLIHIVRPVDTMTLDTTIAPGADITLPFMPEPNYTIRWKPDSFLSCLNCEDPIAQYILNPITYTVYFRDDLRNCYYDSSVYKIAVFPDILVNAPTAFTPNGDGNNDVFYARGMGIKKLLSFKIYNRLGQLLFFSTSEYDGWDGYYKGILQNSDTYFYTIEGESFIPDKIVHKEGNFLLLR